MYCPKCGTENPDGAQLCRSCSWPLRSVSAALPRPEAKTSGLAIASLVMAILSPFSCLLTGIPAVILGIVALVKIDKSAGRLKGKGFAVAGIAIPPASLPMVALLLGIMMPALARTRQIAHRMVCGTNLSGLAKAMWVYANDHGWPFPTAEKWCDLLIEYQQVSPSTFRCKGASEGPCNYAINRNVEGLNMDSVPADMVLLFETHPGWNQSGGPEILSTKNHKGEGCNVLFFDSHVKFIKTERLDDLKWKPD